MSGGPFKGSAALMAGGLSLAGLAEIKNGRLPLRTDSSLPNRCDGNESPDKGRLLVWAGGPGDPRTLCRVDAESGVKRASLAGGSSMSGGALRASKLLRTSALTSALQ